MSTSTKEPTPKEILEAQLLIQKYKKANKKTKATVAPKKNGEASTQDKENEEPTKKTDGGEEKDDAIK